MEALTPTTIRHVADPMLSAPRRTWLLPRGRRQGPSRSSPRLACRASSAAGVSHGSVDKALAQLHFRLKEYAKAVEDVLTALKRNPKDKELYLLLGDSYDQLGLRRKGAQARLKALELEATDGMSCSMRALQDAREALEHLRCAEAVSIATAALDRPELCPSPTLQAALYRVISDAQSLMGHAVEAVETERIAVEACPEDVLSRLVLAEKQMELACAQHDISEVVKLATQGIDLSCEFGNQELLHLFYRSRGRALFTQGKVEAALEDFKEYHRLRPESAEPYLLISDSHDILGNTHAAVEAQEKAVRLDPDNERAKVVLTTRLSKLLKERQC